MILFVGETNFVEKLQKKYFYIFKYGSPDPDQRAGALWSGSELFEEKIIWFLYIGLPG